MTSKVINITTLQLKAYKRNLLKPRQRPNRKTQGGASTAIGGKRTPQITTWTAAGFVRRTGTSITT
jgi:hypothetical protein